MKTGKIPIFLITIVVAILTVSACTPSRISVDEYNAGQPAAPTSEPQPVEDTSPDAGEEQDPEPEAEPVEPEEESRGDDVPIMDTATNVQASVSGTNITYQVEGTIEDVVTFYQEELPGYGWEMAGPPDKGVIPPRMMFPFSSGMKSSSEQETINRKGSKIIKKFMIKKKAIEVGIKRYLLLNFEIVMFLVFTVIFKKQD